MANLPVPVPRTFSVSETETGSYMNTIRDALNFLLNPPMFVGYQTSTQSVSNGTWTSMAIDTTVIDSYGGHSNVTNNSRYTAQAAGWYLPVGVAAFTTNATGGRGTRFAKNGTAIQGSASFDMAVSTNATAAPGNSLAMFLNVGDYLEVQGYQTSGGSLSTVSTSDIDSSFAVYWIHS